MVITLTAAVHFDFDTILIDLVGCAGFLASICVGPG